MCHRCKLVLCSSSFSFQKKFAISGSVASRPFLKYNLQLFLSPPVQFSYSWFVLHDIGEFDFRNKTHKSTSPSLLSNTFQSTQIDMTQDHSDPSSYFSLRLFR